VNNIKKTIIAFMIMFFISFPILAQAPEGYVSKEKYQAVVNQLKETTKALEDTTQALIDARDRINKDQKEITDLRTKLEKQLTKDQPKYFSAGVGVRSPLGGEFIWTGDLPFVPIGGYITAGINKDLNLTGSVGIRFRF